MRVDPVVRAETKLSALVTPSAARAPASSSPAARTLFVDGENRAVCVIAFVIGGVAGLEALVVLARVR